jgi:hypothetical protein
MVTKPKTKKPRRVTAAERHRASIIAYYAEPENEPVKKDILATEICGVSRAALYKVLTPREIDEAVSAGLEQRRERYAAFSAAVDHALAKKAIGGHVGAMELFYKRLEGWSEKTEHKIEIGPTDETLRDYAREHGYDEDEFIEIFKSKLAQSKGEKPPVQSIPIGTLVS